MVDGVHAPHAGRMYRVADSLQRLLRFAVIPAGSVEPKAGYELAGASARTALPDLRPTNGNVTATIPSRIVTETNGSSALINRSDHAQSRRKSPSIRW